MFNDVHFYKLAEIFSRGATAQGAVGHIPRSWGEYVFGAHHEVVMKLRDFRVNRETLLRDSHETAVTDLCLAISVLAWGGMNRRYGRDAFKTYEQWALLLSNLRSGEIDRFQAYQEFSDLRKNGRLKGMGPAYFTKLIFFFGAQHDGYIMDQWTGRSINFLCGRVIVEMINLDKGLQRVSDENSLENYKNFCGMLENIAIDLPGDCSPVQAEELIFSSGGKNKGAWRNYLLMNLG